MNDRANIAGNVVLATDLLLINTKLPSNPPYISLSAHTPQRRPAQTSGKEKDHQDLASLPGQPPQLGIFPSSLHGARARSLLRRCPLLKGCLESTSRTFGSVLGAKLPAAWACWSPQKDVGVLEWSSLNQIKVKYIERCVLDRGWGSSKPTWLFGSPSCSHPIGFIRQWSAWLSWIPPNFLLHLGFINSLTPLQSGVLAGFVSPPS